LYLGKSVESTGKNLGVISRSFPLKKPPPKNVNFGRPQDLFNNNKKKKKEGRRSLDTTGGNGRSAKEEITRGKRRENPEVLSRKTRRHKRTSPPDDTKIVNPRSKRVARDAR